MSNISPSRGHANDLITITIPKLVMKSEVLQAVAAGGGIGDVDLIVRFGLELIPTKKTLVNDESITLEVICPPLSRTNWPFHKIPITLNHFIKEVLMDWNYIGEFCYSGIYFVLILIFS